MLAIEKELFQWEKGRYVIVNNPEISTVEFYNKKSEYGDEVMVENGHHGFYTAEIVKEIIYEYFGMNIVSVTEDMSASVETESFR